MDKPFGVQASCITPFDEEGNIKEEAFRKHISWQIESGVHGIGVGPNTGEFINLEFEDVVKMVNIVVDETKNRVPVTVGALSPSMRYNMRIIEYAKKAGADYVLVQAPYYLPPAPEQLVYYFEQLASIGMPMIIFNHPYKTPYNLGPEMLEKLFHIEEFVSVKEVDMNMSKNVLRLECLHSNNRTYLMGEEFMCLYHYLHGGDGSFPALGNIAPHLCVDLYNFCKEGKIKEAMKVHLDMVHLGAAAYVENYPSGLKEGMELVGRDGGVTRKPVGRLKPESRAKLKAVLKELKLI
jgi:4-hydroxy-tetrahydrodipicolinate synthase